MPVTLTRCQSIPTSGARAVEAFRVDDLELLVVPQLAVDVPGEATGINAGDSDTDALVLRRAGEGYRPFATIPAPGGEDAEFFTVGNRSFLALACIRTGAGPYRYDAVSPIYEWVDGVFRLFQEVPSFAARQWRHWAVDGRHFLGLAQGLDVPGLAGNRASQVLEWNGEAFVSFQEITSRWAYNWHPFVLDGTTYVAHAEHLGPSLLYRWDGSSLVAHQQLLASGGRAFETLEHDGSQYLLAAAITSPPVLMRWDGERYSVTQELAGTGGRELKRVELGGRTFVVRVNFITGTPADPEPCLLSQVYEWRAGVLELVAEFPTVGGTDVELLDAGAVAHLAVSHSLTSGLRFAGETVVYELALDEVVA
ncbi:MAG: hypothetical protein JWO46_1251 [Nocardioidaceae bacterium]|nr:hypothetical protein [Nocardioidaceae bacterium]